MAGNPRCFIRRFKQGYFSTPFTFPHCRAAV
jgi:hypothetical protein